MGYAKETMCNLPDWLYDVPYQIKKIAIKDAFTSRNAAVRKFKSSGQVSQLRFKSRKEPQQSCYIPHSAITDVGVYKTISGVLKYSEKLPEGIKDSRLILDRGRWFISVPYAVKVDEFPENQGKVVALDPGIRTFLTGFSENDVFKIGQGDFGRLQRLCSHLDRLFSERAKSTARRKRRITKAINRLSHRITHLVDELHWKTIRFLLSRYDMILLPTFETSGMVKKAGRKLHKKSVRNMMTFRFYEFSQRLLTAAKNSGKVVLRCNEAYTSKTLSWTGQIKQIGSSTVVSDGNIKVDRDVNGARGIFLRALVDTPSLAI